MLKVVVVDAVVAAVAVPTLFGVVGVLVAICILAVDEEILVVVLVVAAAESSGCAHLEDVRVGSLIVQAVQTDLLVEDEVKDSLELYQMRC